MRPLYRSLLLALLAPLLALLLTACHVTLVPAHGAASVPTDVEPGSYVADARWAKFAKTWPTT